MVREVGMREHCADVIKKALASHSILIANATNYAGDE